MEKTGWVTKTAEIWGVTNKIDAMIKLSGDRRDETG